MGSGDRWKFGRTIGIGLGVNFATHPFQLTITLVFLVWYLSLGIGRAYDEEKK